LLPLRCASGGDDAPREEPGADGRLVAYDLSGGGLSPSWHTPWYDGGVALVGFLPSGEACYTVRYSPSARDQDAQTEAAATPQWLLMCKKGREPPRALVVGRGPVPAQLLPSQTGRWWAVVLRRARFVYDLIILDGWSRHTVCAAPDDRHVAPVGWIGDQVLLVRHGARDFGLPSMPPDRWETALVAPASGRVLKEPAQEG
jgi:hypothetical protein